MNLYIEPLYTKTIEIPGSSLTVENRPANMVISYDTTRSINIDMYGLKGDLEQISLENLQPSIDLKGLGAGVHSCLIKVNLSNGIRLMNKPVINVTITEREPETTTPAETESQSSPETASTEESTANMGMETNSESVTVAAEPIDPSIDNPIQ